MGMFVALAVGYVIGARTGSKDLDQLTRSLKALAGTDEFADVVAAVRSHAGHTLRELASVVDGHTPDAPADGDAGDLVDRVKQLVGHS
jgi:hypothetical protein